MSQKSLALQRRVPRLVLLLGLALAVVTLVAYGQTCLNDFVNYDDGLYVKKNGHVLTGLSSANVYWAWTTTHASNWHPLTWLSLQLDTELFGPWAFGYHLTNLLLHLANVLLLFGVLYRLTAAPWRSGWVAALFAVHPLHVESVAWVSERKDVLSTLFWMLTLWAYVGYVRRPGWARYASVVLAFTLGLLAKPMLVTLPAVLLLLDYWPLGRLQWPGGSQPRPKARGGAVDPSPAEAVPLRRLVGEKFPLFVLAAASCVVTLIAQRRVVQPLEAIPVEIRILNAAVAYVSYLVQMFVPVGLANLYPHPRGSLSLGEGLGALVVLAALSFLVLRAAQRRPYLPVGWLWYLGTLVPVIGLVQVGQQARADRYTYVPLIGVFIMLAWGVPELLARRPAARVALAVTALLVVVGCSAATWVQVGYWHDSVALWEHTIEVTGDNAYAENKLGLALKEQGKLPEAVQHFQRALTLDPDDAEAHVNLALALRVQGRFPEAEQEFARALAADPADALAHAKLGLMLAQQGKIHEGIEHLRRALEIHPDCVECHNDLGMALEAQGQREDAKQEFTAALRLDAGYREAHQNLGQALLLQGQLDEAADHFAAAAQLDPGSAEAHNYLGMAYQGLGRLPQAAACYRQAIALNPLVAVYHANLGSALYEQGDREAARAEYRKATELDPGWREAACQRAWALATDPDPRRRSGTVAVQLARPACEASEEQDPHLLDVLAAAYAEAGHLDAAVATAHEALARATGPQAQWRTLIEQHLRLYEQGQPLRENRP